MAVAASLALAGCASAPPRETLLDGETMGSAWTVKIAGSLPLDREHLQAGVQARFEAVNQALSTYRADSALSRFNDHGGENWVDIDPELAQVLEYALSLAQLSDGAYDVTVGPLVNIWGFGPDPATHRVPTDSAIAAARAHVGWRKVEVDVERHRARKQPGVRIDLSSLGKGRGVDRVAEYLDAQGVANYLIDLSGKLRARGRNAHGMAWQVAVEQPAPDYPSGAAIEVPAVVPLRDESIATAGDYRRFFESGGRHYSHIIDPRTGAPVAHATMSATALGPTCMQADALATLFMVMEPAAALRIAVGLGVPALLIRREGSGFRLERSAAWRDR
ncbi:MAG TPA: FAD:protein FMN transferase [Steroidobacteraceae bacterium]|nr:FAD:protein FMN transferase [Steroidobacteraceae bacterium]